MDAIKLEMDKNDQFEMIKYSPPSIPHLSDAALDGLHITNSLHEPVFLQFKWTGRASYAWMHSISQSSLSDRASESKAAWLRWKSIGPFLPYISSSLMAFEKF